MAEDSAQDRDLPASAKRRQEARDKGQVSRSRDFTSALLLLGGAAGILYGGGWLYQTGGAMLHFALHIPAEAARDPDKMMVFAGHIAMYGVMLLAPVLLLAFALGLGGSLAIGGWVFSVDALMPDFSRLDPGAGLGRMFSTHGLGELVKAALKALVVGTVVCAVLWSRRGPLMQLLQIDPVLAPTQLALLCARAFFWIATATVLIGAIDVPWQIYQLNEKLKMSHQDLKDEAKESDGNPQVKQRMRQLQRERARRRMMAAVPKADVVVTNPTHYAVALAYKEGTNRAPVVLAMGTDHMAARIRELAREHGVPLVEAPPLARALYRYADLEREIPASLYNAVALLLAYVYQLRVLPQRAQMPHDWAIPSELDTSAESAMPVH